MKKCDVGVASSGIRSYHVSWQSANRFKYWNDTHKTAWWPCTPIFSLRLYVVRMPKYYDPERYLCRHCGGFTRFERPWIRKIYIFLIPSVAVAWLVEALWYKQKVSGSIPDEVIGFFNWPNPSSRAKTLGSTQPLTEMSTKTLPWGGGGG
jgi:hypothetical protein